MACMEFDLSRGSTHPKWIPCLDRCTGAYRRLEATAQVLEFRVRDSGQALRVWGGGFRGLIRDQDYVSGHERPVAGFRMLFSRGRERAAETILLFHVATPSLCAQEFSYTVYPEGPSTQ